MKGRSMTEDTVRSSHLEIQVFTKNKEKFDNNKKKKC